MAFFFDFSLMNCPLATHIYQQQLPQRMTTIEELTAKIRKFNAERDWDQYHNPKEVLIALVSEVGELADLYRWLSPAEVERVHRDPAKKLQIEEELADIFTYLLIIAYKTETDLIEATERKMVKNARKYPVERIKSIHSNRLEGIKGKE